MAATALTDRYAANLHGVLSCYDRIIITGTLPGACYAGGMTSFLYAHGIRIFDYPRFAEPLRDRIRQRAQEVCEANGVSVEHFGAQGAGEQRDDLVGAHFRLERLRGDDQRIARRGHGTVGEQSDHLVGVSMAGQQVRVVINQ